MELRLTDKEQELLLEILREQHKHLLHEISKASHHEAKIMLRERCTSVEELIRKLNASVLV